MSRRRIAFAASAARFGGRLPRSRYGQECIAAGRDHRAVRGGRRRSTRAFSPTNNLTRIFSGNAYIAVAAIGMSMVIISGNIDVSVGSLIGVLATISGTLAVAASRSGWPGLVPILVGIAVNAVVGRAGRLYCASPRSS